MKQLIKTTAIKMRWIFAAMFIISAFIAAGANDYSVLHDTDFNWWTMLPAVISGSVSFWAIYNNNK